MLDNVANNNRIVKNTLLLYTRMMILMAVSLFTSRINLQALGVEDFGIYNVVGGFVAMFSMLSGALSVSISRNIAYELGKEDNTKIGAIFSTSINVQVAIAIVILILAETFGVWFLNNKMVIPVDRLGAANWVMQFSIVSFVVSLISLPYNAVIIAHEKMSAFTFISILETVLKLGVAYFLYISPFDKLITYAALMMLISVALREVYAVYCRKHFKECKYQFIYDKALIKQLVGFAGWSMFGLVAYTGYTYGLNILLNLFFGPTVNAARGIAVQVQNAVQGFSQNFQIALNPQIIKSYAVNNLERVNSLVYSTSKYVFFLLLLFTIPLTIEAPIVLNIWLGNVPNHTVSFVRLIMMIITFDSLGSSISTAQQATGNIRTYQIIVGGIMLMIVPVAYIVLKFGGNPESVYVVYLISCIVAHICRLFIIRKMINLSLRKYLRDVIKPIVLVTVVSFIPPFAISISLDDSIYSLVLVCIFSTLSLFLSVYILGLTPLERSFVKEKILELLRFVKVHE